MMYKNRIFYLSILLSVAAHLFWLSAVKVVATKEARQRIKFSQISFLGPLTEKASALEVGIALRERTFLEKRNLIMAQGAFTAVRSAIYAAGRRTQEQEKARPFGDRKMTPFIEEALSGSKLEPV